MCAENNLGTSFFANDSAEIVKGAANLPDNVNLLVYADRSSKAMKPYIAKVDKDGMHIVKQYKTDLYSTERGIILYTKDSRCSCHGIFHPYICLIKITGSVSSEVA